MKKILCALFFLSMCYEESAHAMMGSEEFKEQNALKAKVVIYIPKEEREETFPFFLHLKHLLNEEYLKELDRLPQGNNLMSSDFFKTCEKIDNSINENHEKDDDIKEIIEYFKKIKEDFRNFSEKRNEYTFVQKKFQGYDFEESAIEKLKNHTNDSELNLNKLKDELIKDLRILQTELVIHKYNHFGYKERVLKNFEENIKKIDHLIAENIKRKDLKKGKIIQEYMKDKKKDKIIYLYRDLLKIKEKKNNIEYKTKAAENLFEEIGF